MLTIFTFNIWKHGALKTIQTKVIWYLEGMISKNQKNKNKTKQNKTKNKTKQNKTKQNKTKAKTKKNKKQKTKTKTKTKQGTKQTNKQNKKQNKTKQNKIKQNKTQQKTKNKQKQNKTNQNHISSWVLRLVILDYSPSSWSYHYMYDFGKWELWDSPLSSKRKC